MKTARLTGPAWCLLAGLVATSGACGGGSSPTKASSPTPVVAVTPTTTPSSTPTVATADSVCRAIGYGTPGVQCGDDKVASVLPFIETAIDTLANRQPQIFNTSILMGDGGYLVLDNDAYYSGMISTLASLGVCATTDPFKTQLWVKNTNDRSEIYVILNSKNHVRRGFGAHVASCTPSSFPLSPEDQFVSVRVGFFGFKCDDPAVVTPQPFLGLLPVVCTGVVTATPKDANGVDTPKNVHGTDISWWLRSGADSVAISPPADGNPFNYVVQARSVGPFSICAQVQQIQGCLNGNVIPYP